jgi:hypothetical protein
MPLLRRRPLLRAAAVGGGAYYMGKRQAEAQEREAYQDARIDELGQAQAPAAPAPTAAAPAAAGGGLSPDAIDRLKELGALHEQGVLTDEEFAQQKSRLLSN